jgi:uncharacterized protein (TIGR02246 family)
VLAIACVLLSASAAGAQSSHRPHQSATPQRAAITAVLKSYQRALNASDVGRVVKLYTDDAVVLAPNAPTAVGIEGIRAAYTGIFKTIHLDLTFKVVEVKVVSPGWAFLRSASTGSTTILADGKQVPSSNHELFVLHKTQGRWKLARYSFSSVLPAS